MNAKGSTRRQFLQASGGTLGMAWLASAWPQVVAAAEHAHSMAGADTADRSKLLFLTAAQARDVDAIATQIVPSGPTPGAHEAGVVYFVDQMLAGALKTRADDFTRDLAAFNAACAAAHPGVAQFADLPYDAQTAYLRQVDKTPFFGNMKFLTVIGLLALPSYGGNAGKQGWKLVGFVDQHAWEPPFGFYDKDYPGFVPYATATTEQPS